MWRSRISTQDITDGHGGESRIINEKEDVGMEIASSEMANNIAQC